MVTVQYVDLELAFDQVNFGGLAGFGEIAAYVSLDTGRVFVVGGDDLEPLDEVPDDLDTSDRYVQVPLKNDLDLGVDLVFRFVERHMPHHHERVSAFFRRRGAYGRFKDFLTEQNRLDEWHAFEAEATKRALTEWAEANGLRVVSAG
jgi:hypothetical protein